MDNQTTYLVELIKSLKSVLKQNEENYYNAVALINWYKTSQEILKSSSEELNKIQEECDHIFETWTSCHREEGYCIKCGIEKKQ